MRLFSFKPDRWLKTITGGGVRVDFKRDRKNRRNAHIKITVPYFYVDKITEKRTWELFCDQMKHYPPKED